MTDARPPGLWDYAAVVWRRRGLILALVVLALATASVAVGLQPLRQEAMARYRATDADVVAEVRDAITLRLFPPEEIAGLEVTATQAGRGLSVVVVGDPARARAFLTRLPEQFRRVAPRPASVPDAEALPASPPLPPVPALPPSPPPPSPVEAWGRELAEVEARLPASEAERAYLTARALRLRELREQARRESAAAGLAQERHAQEVRREQAQYERQLAAYTRQVAAEADRSRARAAAALRPPQVRELTMVHPVLVASASRPWARVLLAAGVGSLVFGILGAFVLEWYEQERARRRG